MRTTITLTGRLREDELPSEVEEALIRAFRGWPEFTRVNTPAG